jgi:hypothetical protein
LALRIHRALDSVKAKAARQTALEAGASEKIADRVEEGVMLYNDLQSAKDVAHYAKRGFEFAKRTL